MMAKWGKGFSLVELLTTLTILLSLITIGIPSFKNTLHRSVLDTTTQKIARVLYSSRQLAVTHGDDITTCMILNNTCQASWQQGFLTIFHDENNNRKTDASEQVFSQIQLESNRAILQWSGSGGRPYLRYNNVGFAKEFGNILITVGSYQKKIVINRAGRLYIKTL